MSYSKILPAPGTLLNMAGVPDPQGLPAPGFSGVNLQSNYDVSLLRSRASNRGLPNTTGSHYWSFSISYHDMEEDQFSAIESFLLGHNTRLNPFYVVLPNYASPKPFSTGNYAQSNIITTSMNYNGISKSVNKQIIMFRRYNNFIYSLSSVNYKDKN
mgnify:CR=1 FL=1